ncbi:ABC transporter permease [Tuwongella immobilis]|uniref:ABC transmembrane type-1 domain-containing protein n=1 Tax=Tuwongella immobilis TaxID=692036 RepID=A0A6C2YH17_9BACT|nr:ABC transporter permease subunit [Tuwongella immobilis]VIP00707.1 iron abc transporter permease : ABC-type Fe3+ transport system, permease component OS=Singulisphaera acidiphila (strain ATCC BAA-1392 / DSM 18658 / VKM B-2454 / MOB10) GN=Sinac_1918 PE=3 SV=1: BPD_transp_1: BPD_transp_1 [Tuwongella immobilis]VTR96832.1 iron abc transporter permease : ABC-type Fe3+ transport system, permease component OS=Singulisphaera acidiphila (strain ATCC BAA-1392 / DSM 18658 / VKM B-2454 / MOB10) GN=Sinac_19
MRWSAPWLIGSALILAVSPLWFPIVTLFSTPDAWQSLLEGGRLARLGGQSLLLATASASLALLIGLPTAILLERSPLPGRLLLRFALRLGLVIPLPILAIVWQGSLGVGGWLRLMLQCDSPYQPWDQGILPAILIHTVHGIPWVVLLMGLALHRVESTLEEDARLRMPPWQVLWRVTVPRCRVMLGIAWAIVAVQCLTEITVTDLMLVRTYAEEVYTQAVLQTIGPARAMAVSLPGIVLPAIGFVVLLRRGAFADLPRGESRPLAPLLVVKRRWIRILVGGMLGGIGLACLLIPLGTLVWKLGGGGDRPWNVSIASTELFRAIRIAGWLGIRSLIESLLVAVIVATGTLRLLDALRNRPRLRGAVLIVAVVAWLMPGPLIGLGLKQAIDIALDTEARLLPAGGPMRTVLYDSPESPLPVWWAQGLRIFPWCVLILAPTLWQIPREYHEWATLEGWSNWQRFRRISWPWAHSAWIRATVVSMIMAMTELPASKLVSIPGHDRLILELFNQMHYGVSRTVAALSLVQISICLGILLAIWGGVRHDAGILISSNETDNPRGSDSVPETERFSESALDQN